MTKKNISLYNTAQLSNKVCWLLQNRHISKDISNMLLAIALYIINNTFRRAYPGYKMLVQNDSTLSDT